MLMKRDKVNLRNDEKVTFEQECAKNKEKNRLIRKLKLNASHGGYIKNNKMCKILSVVLLLYWRKE